MCHLTGRALAYNFLSWHQLKFACQTENDNLTAMEEKVSKSPGKQIDIYDTSTGLPNIFRLNITTSFLF